MRKAVLWWIVPVIAFTGCATRPARVPVLPAGAAVPVPVPTLRSAALRALPAEAWPDLSDDADLLSLRSAVQASLRYFQGMPPEDRFEVGPDTYSAREMADSLMTFSGVLESTQSATEKWASLKNQFTLYQAAGTDDDHKVVFSSYYEPVIPARRSKSSTYRYPLYARPSDLLDADVGAFNPAYQGLRIAGRRQGRSLVPYATREDIDSSHVLNGMGLELAWAKNQLDVLDLQIEGSGWLDLGPAGQVRIRYDGDNGRPYRSVGRYLIDSGRLPAAKFNRQSFRRYLAHHSKECQKLLNVNERYIFFRIDSSTASAYAYGNINVPLTPGRSMATDPKLFPKGMLAWIDTSRAVVGKKNKVKGRRPLKRFMLNQDEGGAIQGPGRVDIFAGHGADAARFATHQWHEGRLYFLVKKKS